jgi:hypothetical protein
VRPSEERERAPKDDEAPPADARASCSWSRCSPPEQARTRGAGRGRGSAAAAVAAAAEAARRPRPHPRAEQESAARRDEEAEEACGAGAEDWLGCLSWGVTGAERVRRKPSIPCARGCDATGTFHHGEIMVFTTSSHLGAVDQPDLETPDLVVSMTIASHQTLGQRGARSYVPDHADRADRPPRRGGGTAYLPHRLVRDARPRSGGRHHLCGADAQARRDGPRGCLRRARLDARGRSQRRRPLPQARREGRRDARRARARLAQGRPRDGVHRRAGRAPVRERSPRLPPPRHGRADRERRRSPLEHGRRDARRLGRRGHRARRDDRSAGARQGALRRAARRSQPARQGEGRGAAGGEGGEAEDPARRRLGQVAREVLRQAHARREQGARPDRAHPLLRRLDRRVGLRERQAAPHAAGSLRRRGARLRDRGERLEGLLPHRRRSHRGRRLDALDLRRPLPGGRPLRPRLRDLHDAAQGHLERVRDREHRRLDLGTQRVALRARVSASAWSATSPA